MSRSPDPLELQSMIAHGARTARPGTGAAARGSAT